MSTPIPTTQKSQFTFVGVTSGSGTSITIAASGTTSTIMDCAGVAPRGIIIPSTWTSANISFNVGRELSNQADPTSAILYPLYSPDGTGIFTVAMVPSSWVAFVPYYFDSVRYIQIVSSIPQVSTTTLDILMMPLYQGIHN